MKIFQRLVLVGSLCASGLSWAKRTELPPTEPPPFEELLFSLRQEEERLCGTLQKCQDSMSHVLAALVGFSRSTPMVLALSSEYPENRVHQVLILRSLVPFLEKTKAHITQQQKNLQEIQQILQKAEDILKNKKFSSSQKQEKLQEILDQKTTPLPESVQRELEQHVSRLAARVHSADALISELDQEIALFFKENPPAEPVFQWPAEGKRVFTFGKKDPKSREIGKGASIHTAPRAFVVAPALGRVVFSGPFRSYGNIIIIDHGSGFHSLIAGLDVLKVSVGETVAPGEYLGRMGKQSSCVTFEIRKEGKSVDPQQFLQKE
ncbi:MAG: peptidoglycan DD-metalloendopeptidase family protein [Holosporales bacterium]|jgi:septal ring factor EnvC (AmiA/AmiB activator)|nr:peptidoglycan DD-metalloendopeptidase family protein [Holosporales bacterium]